MPNDITIYAEIKQILPNHVLALTAKQIIRLNNYFSIPPTISARTAAEQTLPLIRQLARYYASQTAISCPITAGKDSRIVLGIIREFDEKCQCYTIQHSGMDERTPDLSIPAQLAEKI